MSETTVENIKESEIKNPYPLRNLNAKDVFVFSTILKHIGYAELKECFQSAEVKNMIRKLQGAKSASVIDDIGLSIMMEISTVVICNLASAEDSIYQLLSNLSGKTKAEIASLDADIFIAMVIDVFKQDGFRNFFKVVSKLLN